MNIIEAIEITRDVAASNWHANAEERVAIEMVEQLAEAVDRLDFPLTITMSQLLSYNQTIAELERLRAQLAAVPLEELRRQYDVAPMGVHDFGLDAIKVEKWLRSLETQRWLRNREAQP